LICWIAVLQALNDIEYQLPMQALALIIRATRE